MSNNVISFEEKKQQRDRLDELKKKDSNMIIEEMPDEEASKFVKSLKKAKGLNRIW